MSELEQMKRELDDLREGVRLSREAVNDADEMTGIGVYRRIAGREMERRAQAEAAAEELRQAMERLLSQLTEGRDLVSEGMFDLGSWLDAMTLMVKEALRGPPPESDSLCPICGAEWTADHVTAHPAGEVAS